MRWRLVAGISDIRVESVETSIKGVWVIVPSLVINGVTVVSKGRSVKIASIHNEQWLGETLDDPTTVVRGLKEYRTHGVRADLFTFVDKLPTTQPRFSFPMEWESIAAIRVNNFNDWWESLPQETRKNVRRSKKRGVEVKRQELDDELIRGIVEVNNDAPVRQRIPNVHYGKNFEQVKKDQSSFLDRSDFLCAYVDGELIGVLKLVYAGATASILQFHLKPSHQDKRPANALLSKAVEICEARGVPFLVYGLLNYGNKRDSPLREFKLRNGFKEIRVPRYYVPLTFWGRICLKLGIHRGILGLLPPSVINVLVEMRARLYAVWRSIRRCSLMAEQPKSNRQTECSNPPAGSNA